MKLISNGEIAFGKIGYRRKEKGNLVVYYKPYDEEDLRIDDITFIKSLQKVVLFQGSELGSDAYRLTIPTIEAIIAEAKDLGWDLGNIELK